MPHDLDTKPCVGQPRDRNRQPRPGNGVPDLAQTLSSIHGMNGMTQNHSREELVHKYFNRVPQKPSYLGAVDRARRRRPAPCHRPRVAGRCLQRQWPRRFGVSRLPGHPRRWRGRRRRWDQARRLVLGLQAGSLRPTPRHRHPNGRLAAGG